MGTPAKTAGSEKPSTQKAANHHKKNFLHRHSLSIAACAILLCWIVFYIKSDPNTHLGSFFGNAIADWSGVVVTV
ncbi:MAG TPA: hypothetical protein VLW83_09300, partial [Candidatus Acidoferrales bacterium]|nr:hypothetical protein [Candidatus Acidoferrales bacterium]